MFSGRQCFVGCTEQVVVPVKDTVGTVPEHSHRLFNSERVTSDVHRHFLRCLFGLGEPRSNWNFGGGMDDCPAQSVVELFSCWIVVPRGSLVVLDRSDVCRIDGV